MVAVAVAADTAIVMVDNLLLAAFSSGKRDALASQSLSRSRLRLPLTTNSESECSSRLQPTAKYSFTTF